MVFPYNIFQHKTTKYSPFQLLLRRPPILPINSSRITFSLFSMSNISLRKRILSINSAITNNVTIRLVKNLVTLSVIVFSTKIFVGRRKLDVHYSADPKAVVQVNYSTYVDRHKPNVTISICFLSSLIFFMLSFSFPFLYQPLSSNSIYSCVLYVNDAIHVKMKQHKVQFHQH